MCHSGACSKEKSDGERPSLKNTNPDNFPITNSRWYTNGFQLFIYTVNTECLLGKRVVSGKVEKGMKTVRAKGRLGSFLAPCASGRQLEHIDRLVFILTVTLPSLPSRWAPSSTTDSWLVNLCSLYNWWNSVGSIFFLIPFRSSYLVGLVMKKS